MKELLKQNIRKHIVLSENETEEFCDLFEEKSIQKKGFLLREGEVCKFEGFVTKGLFRVYHIDQNGFEQILYFVVENWWITDIDSFCNETPSQLCIEALEDSEVLVITKINKEFAYANLPKIEKLFRVMTQKTHVALQRRMIDNLSKTAESRYIEFTEKYPHIIQRLSNIQIAAYLGITNVFLSNIRKKIVLKK
ncbi:Crp/Fnr family transcriptional regulator [Flavobacterium sp. Fl-77]|uniref:Crp/Fnr family transcriptional regulator n=1 Tax=Flavobacterium flavipigmentatum TaxID=2893884 RepID=A0AAJ2SA31_9FLAO|nr:MULTISPECIES: Crp/Fnr family transcriptional regulator [unclassified Flavobacterium]MDX6182909.1 Crp/Fnr family transcriptional regulator [Flavobacterium sp. Fl-33]MDX6186362.1 Crp/Fnr family transcriptional regulator [Flavobacterium sp. Fl-77]UFH40575.1 Crp/Fnr family transcriptional regulator [Flavobacterium sp. F-70]